MKLAALINDGMSAFVYLERYVNEGSPSGFTLDKTLESDFLPNGPAESINVPVFWVPFERVTTVGNIGQYFPEPPTSEHSVPFPVHPAVLDVFSPRFFRDGGFPQTIVRTQPLACGRTMAFVDRHATFRFVKLHFPRVLGRFDRSLPLHNWLSSLELSREAIRHARSAPPSVGIFPYLGGAYLERTSDSKGGGYLLRDAMPFPHLNEKACLVPAFALWARDQHRDQDLPILIQLVTELSLDMVSLLQLLIYPLLESYAFWAVDCGLIWEDNAQNVVFEFSSNWSRVRVVRRDMADIFKDEELRRDSALLPLCTYHTIVRGVDLDVEMRRSFAYDFKLSRYILDPIVDCCGRYLGWDTVSMRKLVQELSCESIKWPLGYFPRDGGGYGYARERGVSRDHYVRLENAFLYR